MSGAGASKHPRGFKCCLLSTAQGREGATPGVGRAVLPALLKDQEAAVRALRPDGAHLTHVYPVFSKAGEPLETWNDEAVASAMLHLQQNVVGKFDSYDDAEENLRCLIGSAFGGGIPGCLSYPPDSTVMEWTLKYTVAPARLAAPEAGPELSGADGVTGGGAAGRLPGPRQGPLPSAGVSGHGPVSTGTAAATRSASAPGREVATSVEALENHLSGLPLAVIEQERHTKEVEGTLRNQWNELVRSGMRSLWPLEGGAQFVLLKELDNARKVLFVDLVAGAIVYELLTTERGEKMAHIMSPCGKGRMELQYSLQHYKVLQKFVSANPGIASSSNARRANSRSLFEMPDLPDLRSDVQSAASNLNSSSKKNTRTKDAQETSSYYDKRSTLQCKVSELMTGYYGPGGGGPAVASKRARLKQLVEAYLAEPDGGGGAAATGGVTTAMAAEADKLADAGMATHLRCLLETSFLYSKDAQNRYPIDVLSSATCTKTPAVRRSVYFTYTQRVASGCSSPATAAPIMLVAALGTFNSMREAGNAIVDYRRRQDAKPGTPSAAKVTAAAAEYFGISQDMPGVQQPGPAGHGGGAAGPAARVATTAMATGVAAVVATAAAVVDGSDGGGNGGVEEAQTPTRSEQDTSPGPAAIEVPRGGPAAVTTTTAEPPEATAAPPEPPADMGSEWLLEGDIRSKGDRAVGAGRGGKGRARGAGSSGRGAKPAAKGRGKGRRTAPPKAAAGAKRPRRAAAAGAAAAVSAAAAAVDGSDESEAASDETEEEEDLD